MTSDPCYMYQVFNGVVEARLFDPREIPDDWYDSPKAAKAALIKKVEDKPKKLSCGQKTVKVAKAQTDDDSTGFDK